MPHSFPPANRNTQSEKLPSVGIIGAGAMGEALLYGLTRSGVAIDGGVRATCYSAAHAARVRERVGTVIASVEDEPEANLRLVEDSDVVVLAVSPDRLPSVLDEVSGSLRPHALVITMAAGVTLSRLTSMLPTAATVVRVIPNLGGQAGFGVTGVGENGWVGDEQLRVMHELFSTIGGVVTVRDEQLDVVSGLSGTGPAYFYYYTEQLAAAAVELGLSQGQARQFAEQTFVGAAAVMQSSAKAPGELLRHFSDPAGTSLRALQEMATHDVKGMFVKAVIATIVRAQEIAHETESSSPR